MNTFKKISAHIVALSILLIPVLVSGQQTNTGGAVVNIPNPTNAGSSIMSVLTAILNNVVMPIAAVAVTMWIIYAGFTFLTAQGKPAEIAKAQQRLLWSLIGAGILLGAATISSVVQNTVSGLLNNG
jgi:hypothetical protein